MMKLKATSAKNGSPAIVVSFDDKWFQLLKLNKISVIFRKRGPKSFSPDWIYAYVGAPTSAIVGRMKIKSYSWLSLAEALQFADQGCINKEDLRSYAEGYEEIAVFTVASFEPASEMLQRTTLNREYDFYPPQSFLRLSKDGREEIDRLCGY